MTKEWQPHDNVGISATQILREIILANLESQKLQNFDSFSRSELSFLVN